MWSSHPTQCISSPAGVGWQLACALPCAGPLKTNQIWAVSFTMGFKAHFSEHTSLTYVHLNACQAHQVLWAYSNISVSIILLSNTRSIIDF